MKSEKLAQRRIVEPVTKTNRPKGGVSLAQALVAIAVVSAMFGMLSTEGMSLVVIIGIGIFAPCLILGFFVLAAVYDDYRIEQTERRRLAHLKRKQSIEREFKNKGA